MFAVSIATFQRIIYTRLSPGKESGWLEALPWGLRGRREMHRVFYSGAFKATLLRQEKTAKERLENV